MISPNILNQLLVNLFYQPLILLFIAYQDYNMTETLLNNSINLDASRHTLNTSGSKQKFSFPKS